MINILAFSGSTRSGSYNKKILDIAIQGAKNTGANVTLIDLREYKLPLYDGDLEDSDGTPINCTKLKNLFLAHQGFLFALPEYNSSFSAVFKNTIDWISRPTPKETEPLSCFKNKTAALISASTSKLGGIRGLIHAREMLVNINVMVIPTQVCVASANTAFDESGHLKEARLSQSLEALGSDLAKTLKIINIDPVPTYDANKIDSIPVKLHSKLDRKLVQEFENEGGGSAF